jgi:hypothetical protein
MEDYHGPALEYEELESMGNHDSNAVRPGSSSGLPMRPGPQLSSRRTDSGEGPSIRRQHGLFTNDELGAEPPQYALRDREESTGSQNGPAEDYEEGTASTAQH